jgi:hypothetical protein
MTSRPRSSRGTEAPVYNPCMDGSPEDRPALPVGSSPRRGRWRNRRNVAALAIAVAADALQIGLAPLFIEGAAAPWNDALDVAVGGMLVALLGWHVAFLPAFLGELVPFFDLFPTWTAAVMFVVTRRS